MLATLDVVLTVNGDEFAGIDANVVALIAALEAAPVGPAPKPLTPSTRQPHLPAVCAIGEAGVPPLTAKVLPPEPIVTVPSESAICSV